MVKGILRFAQDDGGGVSIRSSAAEKPAREIIAALTGQLALCRAGSMSRKLSTMRVELEEWRPLVEEFRTAIIEVAATA